MMTQRSLSNSRDEGEENSETIPLDLVIEILMKLPVKSITRFRCVSKMWDSTLRCPNFTDSFLAVSSSTPKLLFTCQKEGETFFFTSPQPQDSFTLTASFHMKFPIDCRFDISQPVRGLICGKNQHTVEGRTSTVPLICNPSTGESFALPRVESTREDVISYFGYDPVHKQFKVLYMTKPDNGYSSCEEHQVLTLGTGKELSWRMIKCDVSHRPVRLVHDMINGFHDCMMTCINGVLYYMAHVFDIDVDVRPEVVCFDIRSEKFHCLKRAHGMRTDYGEALKYTLVNYQGKLAMLQLNIVNTICTGIELWVLEDAEKHEWSSYIYIFPENIVTDREFRFVGMTCTGEIVLSPKCIYDSFYLLYYNPKKNIITRVEIQGMGAFRSCKAYVFLDHVENVMYMKSAWDPGHLK